jgi:hypothetical protein
MQLYRSILWTLMLWKQFDVVQKNIIFWGAEYIVTFSLNYPNLEVALWI